MNRELYELHKDLEAYYRAGYNNDSVQVKTMWKQIDPLERDW